MKRRIKSFILSICLFLSVMGPNVQANMQIPVDSVNIDEVFYVEGQDAVTGETILQPTIAVSWDNPSEWAIGTDATAVHAPSFYRVYVDNVTMDTTANFDINQGDGAFNSQSFDLQEEIDLKTGSVYDIKVVPYHYHIQDDGTLDLAANTGTAAGAYAITDPKVDFETTESTMTVIWDDLGSSEFTYRIVYAVGDYSAESKQTLINNKEGEIIGLTSDSEGVTRFYDSNERRHKLSYTVESGIYPGQVYSVIVEPTVSSFNGKSVVRNINYPYIHTCSTNVNLSLYEDGDYLRLEWDVPDSFKVGQEKAEYELTEATLIQTQGGKSSNIAIFDKAAAIIGYYRIPKPSDETDYQITFVYSAVADQTKPDIKPVSNVVTYVPSDLQITPTRPQVPALFSQSLLDGWKSAGKTTEQIRVLLADDYLVSGYSYAASLDELINTNLTYHVLEENRGINLTWGAFERIDVNEDSPTYGDYIYDTNVYYDIWVTDGINALGYATKTVDSMRYTSLNSENLIQDADEVFGYSQILDSYYNDETGAIEDLVQGKLYYIKLVAKKQIGTAYLTSEPTIFALYYGYDGAAYAPPVITRPPLKVRDSATTQTEATIEWFESWWEVYPLPADGSDYAAPEGWSHQVWVDDQGNISTSQDSSADQTYFAIYEGAAEIEDFTQYMKAFDPEFEVISREIDLGEDSFGVSDVQYQFVALEYADVQDAIEAGQAGNPDYSFSDYFTELIEADQEGTKNLVWEDILPGRDMLDANLLYYSEENLLPNTTYLFILYPYRITTSGELLYAHYPTPIVVSTEAEAGEVNPDPTVPNLYVTDETDMSITLSWKYNTDFNYELIMSTVEDITQAQPLDFTAVETPIDGTYFEYTVEDLFPDTDYYFWIRATQPSNGNKSSWSNNLMGTTLDVAPPYPPNGFGMAALSTMKSFGYDAAVTDTYLALEWVLDVADVEQAADTVVTKNYSYIVEVSNNAQFVDPIYIESTGGAEDVVPDGVEILDKNVVKINELIANRPYYVRCKTRVTVTGAQEGQLIVKDSSSYTNTIRILTVKSEDEYDGSVDPGQQVLPSDDYEYSYDEDTKTLTFRFRSDEAGDANVDQRFISALIEQNIFTYTVDVSGYEGEQIDNRIVEIPYSVMEAFNTYEVAVEIDAGDMILRLPENALYYPIAAQVSQYGSAPTTIIRIKTLDEGLVEQERGDATIRSVADAHQVGVTVNSSRRKESIYYADVPLEVALAANNTFEEFRVERIGAIKDQDDVWSDVAAVFDSETGYMTYETAKFGTYGGYVIDTVVDSISSDAGHWSKTYRQNVFARYNVLGLGVYNPDLKVTEADLVQIFHGLLRNQKNIDLTQDASTTMAEELRNAGVKRNTSISKSQVTREEAVSMMARAYELIHNQLVTADPVIMAAANSNSLISSTYKKGMAEGATIGLISDINKARPKDGVTYGELFALWSGLLDY